ncbi:hypothetical protein JB92DRAFT_3133617 [Gautieria morchelliformis]|nr:hypothetical protein JB92DRAFT_3133617 [Gautieria morchelliformis]
MGKTAALTTNNSPKTSTRATAITEHADSSRTKGVTQGMTEEGREKPDRETPTRTRTTRQRSSSEGSGPCLIFRWASGRHVKGGAFAEALFHDVYIRHLKGLEAWRSFNAKSAKSLAQLKESLHDNGRLHARLPILQDDPKPHFNMTKFSLAAQAISPHSTGATAHDGLLALGDEST